MHFGADKIYHINFQVTVTSTAVFQKLLPPRRKVQICHRSRLGLELGLMVNNYPYNVLVVSSHDYEQRVSIRYVVSKEYVTKSLSN